MFSVTEVCIKLVDGNNERLLAFCSITLDDCFVIRDLKIIQGSNGPFLAMPSRKITDRCSGCGGKNHLRAHYCNQCGTRLNEWRGERDPVGRFKLHADIAHPVNSSCRDYVQSVVLKALDVEKLRAMQPGYVCRYDECGDDDAAEFEAAMKKAGRIVA